MKINFITSSFKFLPAFLLFFLFFFPQPTFAVNEICSDGTATCCTPPPIVAGGGGCDPIGGQPSYWIAGKCAVPSSTPYPCTTKFSCETGSCTSAPGGTSTCKSNEIHIGGGKCADWVSIIREKGSNLFKLWYGEILGRVVFLPDADCTDGYVPGWNSATKKWGCVQNSRWKTSTVNSNDIYYNTGNVGIGTVDPKATLHVQGNLRISPLANCKKIVSDGQGLLYCAGTTPPVVCGNGLIQTGEQCDDGNIVSGDGCSSTCISEAVAFCGNGIVESGEWCDDGNLVWGDGCGTDCLCPGAGYNSCYDKAEGFKYCSSSGSPIVYSSGVCVLNNGCMIGQDTPCTGGTCDNVTKLCTSCVNECTDNPYYLWDKLQCSSDGKNLMSCADHDSDGCLELGVVQFCTNGCTNCDYPYGAFCNENASGYPAYNSGNCPAYNP